MRYSDQLTPSRALEYLRACTFTLGSGYTYRGVDENVGAEISFHLHRYLKTIAAIPQHKSESEILELGAAPFFMSALLYGFMTSRLHLSMYYHQDQFRPPLTIKHATSTFEVTTPFQAFNVEKDGFPYPDQAFDVVLCAELLEHLIFNPLHLLSEIHRVLKKDGYLVLTTPNVLRPSHLATLLRGENIFDPYYAGSTYARHTRLYTPQEVKSLLEMTGFSAISVSTESIAGSQRSSTKASLLQTITKGACHLLDNIRTHRIPSGSRGDMILAIAKPTEQFINEPPRPIMIGTKELLAKQHHAFPSEL